MIGTGFQRLTILLFFLFGGISLLNSQSKYSIAPPTVVKLKNRPEPDRIKATPPGMGFRKYGVKEGLAMQTVLCAAEDVHGNLYFGHWGAGISKFNGTDFEVFRVKSGLLSNTANSLKSDQKGNLWIGSDKGLQKYDGIGFVNYERIDGLGKIRVNVIETDRNGNVWVGTTSGLIRIQDGQIDVFTKDHGLTDNFIVSLLPSSAGGMWIGTYYGIHHFDGDRFSLLSGMEKRDILDPRGLVEDEDGRLWIACHKMGLFLFQEDSLVNILKPRELKDMELTCATITPQGELWVGSNKGILSYDEKKFKFITTKQGLNDNYITDIMRTKNGQIWLCFRAGGIARYDGGLTTTYSSASGLFRSNENVRSMVQDEMGNLWFSTWGAGICRFDGEEYRIYNTTQGLPSDWVTLSFRASNGDMWFATNNGAVQMTNEDEFRIFQRAQGLPSNRIYSFAEDREGNIWIGTNAGVSRYNENDVLTFKLDDGLAGNSVISMLTDEDGKIWMVFNDGGISAYDGKYITSYFAEDGAPSDIWNVGMDQGGNLWVGTFGKGLFRFDGKDFLQFTIQDGLADDNVYDFLIDSSGYIWVGTNLGYSVLSFESADGSFTPAGTISEDNSSISENYVPHWKYFNFSTGVDIGDLNNNAMYFLEKPLPYGNVGEIGSLWCGEGSRRVICLKPFDMIDEQNNPMVSITQVIVDEQPLSWYSLLKMKGGSDPYPNILIRSQKESLEYGWPLSQEERNDLKEEMNGVEFSGIQPYVNVPKDLTLNYDHNRLMIHFRAIETAYNETIEYRYKLKGADSKWSPATRRNFATYTNLREGKYTFMVKARRDGIPWTKAKEYTFVVRPPWYRTWWSYTLYGLSTISLLLFSTNFRTKQLRKRQWVLKKRVELATAEIKSQKEEIELSHREIKKSIRYARRIQEAIMPSRKTFQQNFKDSFVLYKPKDVVAGDFYWMEVRDGKVLFAAADCTGHGVPGAMVSVICNNGLNRSVREHGLTDPGKILDKTREIVIQEFEKSEEKVNDGMDIALCVIDGKKLLFAGAHNPLWVIRNGELVEYKADKQPIGKYDHAEPYKTYALDLEDGDCLYVFSDGYADQFGGPKQKKFMAKNFKKLLLEINEKPMEAQGELIDQAFEDWRGNIMQIDDVCVIGVRI